MVYYTTGANILSLLLMSHRPTAALGVVALYYYCIHLAIVVALIHLCSTATLYSIMQWEHWGRDWYRQDGRVSVTSSYAVLTCNSWSVLLRVLVAVLLCCVSLCTSSPPCICAVILLLLLHITIVLHMVSICITASLHSWYYVSSVHTSYTVAYRMHYTDRE